MIYIIGFYLFFTFNVTVLSSHSAIKEPFRYSRKTNDEIVEYEPISPCLYGQFVIWYRTFYPVILDVGVGNGRSTILLKETFPQSTITGIDISDTAIAQAKQIEMTNLNFERRDVRETGFSDESVDLITAFQTHFHWQNLEASFMEIRRILKSDGMLLLACEYNKLSYFLPEVQSEEAFRRFLLSVGFELVTSQRKGSMDPL